jgi:ABC-type amino acid transport substrate-binding protein
MKLWKKSPLVALAFAAGCLLSASLVQAQELFDLEKIKADGTLKVGVYNNLLPFSDKGKGIDVEIGEALAAKLGLKARVLPFDADETFSDDLRNMVWRGTLFGYGPADVMMHSPIDDYLIKNENKVLFVAPYAREEIFIARNSEKLPSLDSLEPFGTGQFKIGAEVASISSEVLAGGDGRAYINNLVNFKSPYLAVEAMLKGEIDAVMATRAELEGALFNKPNASKFIVAKARHNNLPAQGWPVGLAVKAANKDLAKALVQAVEELRASGEIEKIFTKYGVRYIRP